MNSLIKEVETSKELKNLWQLPEGWTWKRLDNICKINPRKSKIIRHPDASTSFLPMSGVDEVEGVISQLEIRPYKDVDRGFTYFEEGDILFGKITPCMENGKCAIARYLIDKIGFGSTEFHVLRPQSDVTAEWIHKFLRRLSFRLEAKKYFRGAVGQQRVPAAFLESFVIPVPPSIQIEHYILGRIQEFLTEVQESRKLIEQMSCDIVQVMTATLGKVILDLDQRYPNSPTIGKLLSKNILHLTGGGTPSRNNEKYWIGLVPWVSPKDMKHWYINDSQEHISSIALQETVVKLIPKGSVLTVVRGMILAHTLPVGVTKAEVTINQDIKALIPDDSLIPEYLGYVLRARAPSILRQVEMAAHGTRKLKTDTLMQVVVPCISKNEQRKIVEYLNSVQLDVNEMQKLIKQDAKMIDQLEQSILEQAFKGKL